MENRQAIPRRIRIIDKEFQYRMITSWFLMTIGFVLFILISIWFSLKIADVSIEAKDLAKFMKILIALNGVAVVILAVAFFYYSVRESHKIAGPAYRLGVSIRRMSEGDYNFRIALRKSDYLKPIANGLNVLLEDLEFRRTQVQEAYEKSKNLSERINSLENVPAAMRELAFTVPSLLERALIKKEAVPTPQEVQEIKP
jgi:methyl-accepting chemotaxis protein